jgi:hypothetical protein
MNPRSWADFRQVARSKGWHHAAIWLTGDGSAENPRRFTYVIDGITRTAPNPNRTMTTPFLRRFSDTRPNSVQNFYVDDVEVGIGAPKAFSQALFVGRILPECWRTDSNGYADVEGWIVDIEIYDANDNLLATLERRLPKKDPFYNFVDGEDDYTGLIGVPNLLPAGYSHEGTYKFRFSLRGRPFVPATVTLNTPSRGQTIILACGDINQDGCVDDADLLAVLFAFGNTGENLPEDANGDGTVDDADLLVGAVQLRRGLLTCASLSPAQRGAGGARLLAGVYSPAGASRHAFRDTSHSGRTGARPRHGRDYPADLRHQQLPATLD